MRRSFHIKPLFRALMLAGLAFLLSGCLYLRLYELKHQLQAFDENFSADGFPGLSFNFKQPVIRDGDLLFITGSHATSVQTLSTEPSSELWRWEFAKSLGSPESRPYSLSFETLFENGLLARMNIDPDFVDLIGREFIVSMFQRMGHAEIHLWRRSASAALTGDSLADLPRPDMRRILQIMGEPTRHHSRDSAPEEEFEYEFVFRNPETRKIAAQFTIAFVWNPSTPEKGISEFHVTGKAR